MITISIKKRKLEWILTCHGCFNMNRAIALKTLRPEHFIIKDEEYVEFNISDLLGENNNSTIYCLNCANKLLTKSIVKIDKCNETGELG